KPAVRNFRGDDGNVGIMRSPVRAIVLPGKSPCPDLARGRGGQPPGLLYNALFRPAPLRIGNPNALFRPAPLAARRQRPPRTGGDGGVPSGQRQLTAAARR